MSSRFAGRWQTATGAALILLAAAVAMWPQWRLGVSCGHDFDFHLVSWLDAQQSWRQGIFYPHWTPSANYDAGEPRFVFYPPLTWMLGAALGLLMPWSAVPLALTFLLLAATGIATRALARLAFTQGAATLAGCTAIFSGYALFTAYERSAFGELTGGFWIPLALLFLLRERQPQASTLRRAFDGSAAPLALVIAGAWLSNAPVGVMTCYLLAAVALLIAFTRRSWAPVLRAAIGTGLGLGLAAVYLVPAAVEQAWVDIRQVTQDPGEMIENSWLFGRHANPALELHDIELMRVSAIGASMIAVAICALILLWRRGSLDRRLDRRHWLPLAVIPFAVLLLQLPLSLPLWNLLPKLRFLQFPWRWYVVLEAPMAICFAGAVWMRRRWARHLALAACAVFFLAVTVATHLFLFQYCDEQDAVAGMLVAYRTGAGFEGTDEYAPSGADNAILATNLPDACLLSDPATPLGQGAADTTPAWDPSQGTCQSTFTFTRNSPEHRRLAALLPRSGYLVLRLRRYPAWRIALNGQPVSALTLREDGLIALAVPAGPVHLAVDWSTTRDALIGRWIGALALFLLITVCLLERKLDCPRLS